MLAEAVGGGFGQWRGGTVGGAIKREALMREWWGETQEQWHQRKLGKKKGHIEDHLCCFSRA